MPLEKKDLDAIQAMIRESSQHSVEAALRQATTMRPVSAPPTDLVYTRQNGEYYSTGTGKRYRKYNGTLLEIPTSER